MVDRCTSPPPSTDALILASILKNPDKPARGGFLYTRHVEVYEKLIKRRNGLYVNRPGFVLRATRRFGCLIGIGSKHDWRWLSEALPVFYCERCSLMVYKTFVGEAPDHCADSMDLVHDEAVAAEVMET